MALVIKRFIKLEVLTSLRIIAWRRECSWLRPFGLMVYCKTVVCLNYTVAPIACYAAALEKKTKVVKLNTTS